MRQEIGGLKPFLDGVYRQYHTLESVRQDPLSFPRRYLDPIDVEAAAIIASSFAFGRVAAFMPVIERLLGRLGSHPGRALAEADPADLARVSEGLIYRFATTDNIRALLELTSQALRRHGTLEPLFMAGFADGTTVDGLISLADGLRQGGFHQGGAARDRDNPVASLRHDAHDLPDPGFLVPLGGRDSPMKRLCMFLRWMVRNDGIDIGLWKGIRPADLLFPMDVHVFRISGLLGLLPDQSPSRKTPAPRMRDSIMLTRALTELDPEDPVRYDFAISHLGISGLCRGTGGPSCLNCPLHDVCGVC